MHGKLYEVIYDCVAQNTYHRTSGLPALARKVPPCTTHSIFISIEVNRLNAIRYLHTFDTKSISPVHWNKNAFQRVMDRMNDASNILLR